MADFQDTTNMANAMRPVYNETINNLKEIYKPTVDLFSKGKAEIVKKGYGTGWLFPVALGGNRGAMKAITENEALAAALRQRHDQFTVLTKIYTGQIKLSELVMLASDKMGGFNADALSIEEDGLIDDILDWMNIDIWGYGEGVVGKVKTTVTGTVIEMDAPYGIRNIREYDLLDVVTELAGGDGTPVATGAVTAIDEENETITITTSQTITAGSYLVRETAQDSTFPTNGRHIMGINGIVDDGTLVSTFQNIARSGVRKVQGHVMTAGSNREISQLLMQSAFHKAQRSNGGKKISPDDYKFFTSEGIHDSYLELLLPARVFNTSTFDGGYKGILDFNGVEIRAEYTHPKNQMELMNLKETKFYELSPLGFVEGYHQNMLIRTSGYLTWEGALAWFCNMGCVKPRCNVKIEKIAE